MRHATQPEPSRTVCVVPTRNRAMYAARSVRSVLDANLPGVTVLVSDNSTDESEADRLARFCVGQEQRRLSYVRPPAPLGMSEHWEWAVGRALADPVVERVLFLTDRMAFREGDLHRVLEVSDAVPDRVVT